MGGRRSHDNTAQRAGRATGARKARRRVATPPHRKSKPCASSANLPPRPGKRPVRSPGWHTSSASGRSRSASGSARRTSTRVDPGVTSSEAARIRELERENRELRRANEIPMSSLGFLRGRVDRPQRPSPALEVNRELGVEPICRTLQVAPSTYYEYYEARSRQPSARADYSGVFAHLFRSFRPPRSRAGVAAGIAGSIPSVSPPSWWSSDVGSWYCGVLLGPAGCHRRT